MRGTPLQGRSSPFVHQSSSTPHRANQGLARTADAFPDGRITPIPPPQVPAAPSRVLTQPSRAVIPPLRAPASPPRTSVTPALAVTRTSQSAIRPPLLTVPLPKSTTGPGQTFIPPPKPGTVPAGPAQPTRKSVLAAPEVRLPPAQAGPAPASGMAYPRIRVILNSSPRRPFASTPLRGSFSLDGEAGDVEESLATSDLDPVSRRQTATGIGMRTAPSASSAAAVAEAATTALAFGPAPQPKRRGRPKGWKPGMPSKRNPQGNPELLAANAQRQREKQLQQQRRQNRDNAGPKRRRRPPRQLSPAPRAVYEKLEPKFVPFLCEWAGCRAELHNAATLRKHVAVVHGGGGRSSSSETEKRATILTCRWGKCGKGQLPPPRFETREELEAHVERRHLVPFVWHMGDGCTNRGGYGATSLSGDEGTRKGMRQGKGLDGARSVPAYLLDAEGNQVTPSVEGQKVESLATHLARRRQLRALLIQADENAPLEEDMLMEDLSD